MKYTEEQSNILMVTRRAYLTIIGAGIGGLAGCSSSASQGRIKSIMVQNLDNERHQVHLLLLEESDIKKWSSVEIDRFNEETNTAAVETFKDIPQETGEYTLHARIDKKDWKTLNLNSRCYRIELEIEENGDLGIEYSFCTEG